MINYWEFSLVSIHNNRDVFKRQKLAWTKHFTKAMPAAIVKRVINFWGEVNFSKLFAAMAINIKIFHTTIRSSYHKTNENLKCGQWEINGILYRILTAMGKGNK